ncbi:MAG: 50S ribosomal protein L4 [Chloroflexota bacterium]|nr:50S ribosomal protein L4 [Chloroflexota bacterium]
MQLPVHNLQGELVAQADVSDLVFGIEPNQAVMHQALVRQLANARAGTHNTLTRAEVSGGGRKPWRQKGTGRARQGSIRAPQWRGGGVVFGPHPRSYIQRMPRKMRRLAIRSALSQKMREQRILALDAIADMEPRTKAAVALLRALNLGDQGVLIATHGRREMMERAARGLPNSRVVHASNVGVLDLLKYDYLIIDREALEPLQQTLLEGASQRQVAEAAS